MNSLTKNRCYDLSDFIFQYYQNLLVRPVNHVIDIPFIVSFVVSSFECPGILDTTG